MISFVVPAHNEARFIEETINTIRSLMGKHEDFEIIVVDNASSDKTPELVLNLGVTKLIELKKQVSISAARNIGASAAIGNIFVFLDADVLITEQWVSALTSFEKKAIVNQRQISGHRVVVSKRPCWIETTWFEKMKMPANPSYINSGNLITTKALFADLNGFCESLTTGEDVDFCTRAKKIGAEIVPDKNFVANHEGYPKTIKSFFKREQWHGIGDVESFEKFITSKVILFSYALIFILLISFAGALLGFWLLSLVALLTFFTLNSAATLKRFRMHNFRDYCLVFYLHTIYVIARCTSIFVKQIKRAR